MQDDLPNGRLPTSKHVLRYLLYVNFHNQENQQGANIKNLATDVWTTGFPAMSIQTPWKVYDKNYRRRGKGITIWKNKPMKKKDETFSNGLKEFVEEYKCLFALTETAAEIDFYEELSTKPQIWLNFNTDFDVLLYIIEYHSGVTKHSYWNLCKTQ